MALHPRLNVRIRVLDLAFFIAEHDDHHLARISELRQDLTKLNCDLVSYVQIT
jgi:hypothetical protein